MPDATATTPLHRLIVAAAIAVAAIRITLPTLTHVAVGAGYGDFSSYYYGARVALAGGSPYDLAALDELAKAEIGRSVNPYIYPPPFLLVMAPLAALPVRAARLTWLALELVVMGGAMLLLRRLLGVAGDPKTATLLIAVALATFAPLYDNLLMGQVNFLVMVLLLAGLGRLLCGRDVSGGAFIGAAAIVKMSPALLLLWAVLRGRWRALLGAAAAAAVLALASFAVAGPAVQREFYLEVLPGFSQRFPEVKLRVDWIGNHSLPSAVAALLPGDRPRRLSPAAQAFSGVASLALLAATAWACNGKTRDPRVLLTEASMFLVLMVAFPVFAFEHHLVHLLLPIGILAIGATQGMVTARMAAWLGVGYVLLAIPPAEIQSIERWTGAALPWGVLHHAVREMKLVGMMIVFVTLFTARRRAAQVATA